MPHLIGVCVYMEGLHISVYVIIIDVSVDAFPVDSGKPTGNESARIIRAPVCRMFHISLQHNNVFVSQPICE